MDILLVSDQSKVSFEKKMIELRVQNELVVATLRSEE